jgi:hypothetical protein
MSVLGHRTLAEAERYSADIGSSCQHMGEAELVDKWVPSGFPAQKLAAT